MWWTQLEFQIGSYSEPQSITRPSGLKDKEIELITEITIFFSFFDDFFSETSNRNFLKGTEITRWKGKLTKCHDI